METIVFNVILGLYIFIGLIAIVGCMVSYFVRPKAIQGHSIICFLFIL